MPHILQLSPRLRSLAKDLTTRLPEADGDPIDVRFLPNLHAHRGLVLSESIGLPIHGASDLRKRYMVLDASLRSEPDELRRILVHELFHFAWARLGNPTRHSYGHLLEAELARGARGELGWSAEYRKDALRAVPRVQRSPKLWREYVCESFCDTAAWLYAGLGTHAEFSLPQRYAKLRAGWFRKCFRHRKLFI